MRGESRQTLVLLFGRTGKKIHTITQIQTLGHGEWFAKKKQIVNRQEPLKGGGKE